MAIDFSTTKIYSRGKGHSAVAAAAYRSATTLCDERTGETHNYENKEHVIYNSIMLPDGADEKFLNREYLWNKVEESEKRKDSALCKDIIIALPKELKEEEWIELSRRFTEEHYVSKGIAADIAVHNNEGNPHCHILLTTRRILGNKLSEKKATDLDAGHRYSAKIGKSFLADKNITNNYWRELQNKYFEENHLDIVVDQNYLISQRHEGRVTNEAHYVKQENALKVEQSKEIALNDPDLAVTILSKRNTVMSEKDIESFAYKHSSSKEEFQKVKESIINNKNVIELGPGDDGRLRYTTKHAIKKENVLINDAAKLNKQSNHRVRKKTLKAVISDNSLKEGQEKALKHLLCNSDVSVVVGKPGTGKSYMLNSAREAWEREGYSVNGAAVSGIAVEGLERSSGINSRVIASWNYCIENGYKSLSEKDIFVIDEAGMADSYDLAKLTSHVKSKGAKLVLIGDPDQLQPVGPGASLRGIMEEVGYVEMSEIIRQEKEWQREAISDLSAGNPDGLDAYYNNRNISFADDKSAAVKDLVTDWGQGASSDNIHDSIIIAHTNKDVTLLNHEARQELIAKKILDESLSQTYSSANGEVQLAVGEKILFLKRDRKLKINNGTFGTVVNVGEGRFQVEIREGDNIRNVEIDTSRYKHFNYGYASTVHKLQGATIDNSYLYAGGKGWNRNLALVGLSRHKDDIKIYADRETYKDYDSLKSSFLRDGYKDSVLDYPVSYSLRRGIDPESVLGGALDRIGAVKEKVADKWNFLFDYQKYVEKQQRQERNEELATQRKDAVKVASYMDARYGLYDLSKKIYLELSDDQKFHQHKDYKEYYSSQSEVNKQASYFYDNFEKYERALKANNIDVSDLKSGADAHNREQNVRNFFLAYNTDDKTSLEHYSNEINNDIKGHYRHFDRFNTTEILTKNLPAYIQKQAVLYNYNGHIKEADQHYIKTADDIKNFYDLEIQRKEFWKTLFNDRKPVIHPDAEITVAKNIDLRPLSVPPFMSDEQKETIRQINSDLRETAFEVEKLSWDSKYADVFDVLKIDQGVFEKRRCEYVYDQFNAHRRDVAVSWGQYYEGHQNSDRERALVATERRNIAAYNILQEYERYSDIIEKSKLSKEDIEKYAEAAVSSIESIERIKEYISIQPEGKSGRVNALACEIVLQDEKYSAKLGLICEGQGLNVDEFKEKLEIHSYQHFIKDMTQKEIMEFHVVRDFARSYMEYREVISDNQFKGFDNLSTDERNQMFKLSSVLEVKAHTIYERAEELKDSLGYHHIQDELIDKYENKYQESLLRNKVRTLKTAKVKSEKNWGDVFKKDNEELTRKLSILTAQGATSLRDSVAAEILPNIDNYRGYLDKFKITEEDIIKYANRKKVSDYYYNKVQTAKAFSAYNEDKEGGEEFLHKGLEHIEERNKLAYEIVSNPEQFAEHIKKQNLTQLNGFKNHSNKYSEFLEGEGGEPLSEKAIEESIGKLFPGIKIESVKEKPGIERKEFKRLDYQKINDALLSDPEGTYSRIFGEPKLRSSKELRYPGGLIVTLSGRNAGQWYDFSGSGKCGGGPIQALEYNGMDFKTALERGMEIAGMSPEQAQESVLYKPAPKKIDREKKLRDLQEQRQTIKKRIQTARYYWESSSDINGTIGETYLREHRKITGDISEFRFHNKVLDPETRQYYPGLMVCGKNKYGKVTAVQSILLNPETGNKADVKTVKRTRGILKGSVCLVSQGKVGNPVIVAEGPETGASIASAMPDAHVYITLGNFKNAEQLGWLAKKHNVEVLMLAADNDGDKSRIEKTVQEVGESLQKEGIECVRVKPELEGREKVDFNDVLKEKGLEAVREAFDNPGLDCREEIKSEAVQEADELSSPVVSPDMGEKAIEDDDSYKSRKAALPGDLNSNRLREEKEKVLSEKRQELKALNQELDRYVKDFYEKGSIYKKFHRKAFEIKEEAMYQETEDKRKEIKAVEEMYDKKIKEAIQAEPPKKSKVLEAIEKAKALTVYRKANNMSKGKDNQMEMDDMCL